MTLFGYKTERGDHVLLDDKDVSRIVHWYLHARFPPAIGDEPDLAIRFIFEQNRGVKADG